MDNIFVGRKEEQKILQQVFHSKEAEMVAVIGRRRVGKTYLIQTVYQNKIDFAFTGIQNSSKEEHLQSFSYQLKEFMQVPYPIKEPKNWLEAFHLLINFLKEKQKKEKLVVFLDELPWIATPKSGFLRALGYFWNSWAVQQNIVVVICGSAASWMIQKVVNDRGGLHNRITKRIFLDPFTLKETEEYLLSRNIHFNQYQIAQLYMTMGGIPHYLKEIEGGESAIQNIEKICFSRGGLLRGEFERLYFSLFANAEKHIAVIRALGTKKQGLTRQEIIKISTITNGGSLTKVLDELYQSGFISLYYPFGKKKKEKLYRLSDEYSLFYLQFIEDKIYQGNDTWQHLSQTQAYKTWSGYAFENLCLKHVPQIKKALGIAGIYAAAYSFYKKGTPTEKGAQIDLLLDRNDKVINLFEAKFYDEPYVMTKAYADKLRDKASIFKAATKTRSQLFWVLISAFGLKENKHSIGLISKSLSLEDLFA